MNEDVGAFVLRLGHRLESALQEDVVGIGWCNATGLDEIKDWEAFKKRVADTHPEYDDSARALGNAAGSIWRFIHEMTVGDLVVVPVEGAFHVARVIGDIYYYESAATPDTDFAWRRKVEWLTKEEAVKRSFAGNFLQRRLKARQTCVGATPLLDEIQMARERTTPVSFVDDVLQTAKEYVASAMVSSMNHRQLEELIKKLVEAGGAKASILSTRQEKKGQIDDVDVEAVYDLKIGREDSTIKVAFQVKQHEGTSDKTAVKQLAEAAKEEYVKCYAVTTAERFSDDAIKLAQELDIGLIEKDDLAEWVLFVGLEQLADKK